MIHQNRKPLYTKKSQARLSSPEGLDEMMKVINPKSWLVLIAFTSIILSGVIWGIFGHIPIAFEAKGQLVNLGQIESIRASEKLRIQELKVTNNELVKQGQVLAIIDEFDSRGNIKTKELISRSSGRVLWTALQGDNLNPKNIFAIIEKNDSSFQKSIVCLSSSEECQKIENAKKAKIIITEMPEENSNTTVNSAQDITGNLNPQNLSKIIQVRDNVKIDENFEEKLVNNSKYPVSIRVVKEYSPISFIFPKSESNNGTK